MRFEEKRRHQRHRKERRQHHEKCLGVAPDRRGIDAVKQDRRADTRQRVQQPDASEKLTNTLSGNMLAQCRLDRRRPKPAKCRDDSTRHKQRGLAHKDVAGDANDVGKNSTTQNPISDQLVDVT